jgi:diamine N-acetyltransferase
MNVRFRRTLEDDLDFVLRAEQSAENRAFVFLWSREQHLSALTSEDIAHLIIEELKGGKRVGYIILAGLADKNQSVEFRRVSLSQKRTKAMDMRLCV